MEGVGGSPSACPYGIHLLFQNFWPKFIRQPTLSWVQNVIHSKSHTQVHTPHIPHTSLLYNQQFDHFKNSAGENMIFSIWRNMSQDLSYGHQMALTQPCNTAATSVIIIF